MGTILQKNLTARSYDSISFIYRIDIQAYFSPTILTDKTMGGTSIKKNNNGVMVDRKLWQNRLNYSGSSALMIAVHLQSAQRTSNGTIPWSVGSPPDTTTVQQDRGRFT
jgi:hypothetical protein